MTTQAARKAATLPLRVVLWGTCDTGKPRVRILRDGLRANGVELIECRKDIWSGIEDKSQVHGRLRWLCLLMRIALAYPGLVWRYMRLPRHDWVLLGYPAIPDVFVIRLFAWMRGARVAMDWFLSAYDTVVLDRQLVRARHPLAMLLWGAEWIACRLASCVFMDTAAHARRMEKLFHLAQQSCRHVWVGAEDAFFRAPSSSATSDGSERPLRVLFYGQFIPLHGVPTIVEAARRLREAPVEWLLIGRGQDERAARDLLADAPLPKLRWLEWVEYEALISHIETADVCLGIFGTSDKAASVIPNKVFQVVAAGKCIITRESPAIRELLAEDSRCTHLVAAGDPAALANAILVALQEFHGDRIRPRCHSEARGGITPVAIGEQCLRMLQDGQA